MPQNRSEHSRTIFPAEKTARLLARAGPLRGEGKISSSPANKVWNDDYNALRAEAIECDTIDNSMSTR